MACQMGNHLGVISRVIFSMVKELEMHKRERNLEKDIID